MKEHLSDQRWTHHLLSRHAELDALEDDLAFESILSNANDSESIPSYLRDDVNEALPDLVDEPQAEGKQAAKAV